MSELHNAVTVRPGDKLVVALKQPITMTDAHHIKERLAEALPGVAVVLIDNVAGLAVYRPEQREIRQISYPLGDDEVACLREQGVIGDDGKTFMDQLMEQAFPDSA